jgi:hypothetical protein
VPRSNHRLNQYQYYRCIRYTIGYLHCADVAIFIDRVILFMVTGGNRETKLVAVVAVKANSVKPTFDRHNMSHQIGC